MLLDREGAAMFRYKRPRYIATLESNIALGPYPSKRARTGDDPTSTDSGT